MPGMPFPGFQSPGRVELGAGRRLRVLRRTLRCSQARRARQSLWALEIRPTDLKMSLGEARGHWKRCWPSGTHRGTGLRTVTRDLDVFGFQFVTVPHLSHLGKCFHHFPLPSPYIHSNSKSVLSSNYISDSVTSWLLCFSSAGPSRHLVTGLRNNFLTGFPPQ